MICNKRSYRRKKSCWHIFLSKTSFDKEIVTNNKSIEKHFNKFFTENSPKFANKTSPSSGNFNIYLSECKKKTF